MKLIAFIYLFLLLDAPACEWEEHMCIFLAGASGVHLSLKENVGKPPAHLEQVKTRAFQKLWPGNMVPH